MPFNGRAENEVQGDNAERYQRFCNFSLTYVIITYSAH